MNQATLHKLTFYSAHAITSPPEFLRNISRGCRKQKRHEGKEETPSISNLSVNLKDTQRSLDAHAGGSHIEEIA